MEDQVTNEIEPTEVDDAVETPEVVDVVDTPSGEPGGEVPEVEPEPAPDPMAVMDEKISSMQEQVQNLIGTLTEKATPQSQEPGKQELSKEDAKYLKGTMTREDALKLWENLEAEKVILQEKEVTNKRIREVADALETEIPNIWEDKAARKLNPELVKEADRYWSDPAALLELVAKHVLTKGAPPRRPRPAGANLTTASGKGGTPKRVEDMTLEDVENAPPGFFKGKK